MDATSSGARTPRSYNSFSFNPNKQRLINELESKLIITQLN
jgi:hypothetical protein